MRLLTASNVVSACRLALAGVFPFVPSDWRLTVVVVGGLSDAVDGLLARLTKSKSVAGVIIDPVADKCFALSIMLTLAVAGDIAWWQLAPILSRDVVAAVAGITLWVRKRWSAAGLLTAMPLGKVATVFEYGWFVSLFMPSAAAARWPLFGLASAACIATAIQFAFRLTAALRADEQNSEFQPKTD